MARKRFDDEVAKILAILDGPDPKAAQRSAEAALHMAMGAGSGPLRQQHLVQAQEFIAQMDPHREGEAIQELQGHVLALQGRGGDTRIAHVTRGERFIPASMQTPEVMAALARAAKQAGLNPRRFRVGQGRVNPRTGHEEFYEPTYVAADNVPVPPQSGDDLDRNPHSGPFGAPPIIQRGPQTQEEHDRNETLKKVLDGMMMLWGRSGRMFFPPGQTPKFPENGPGDTSGN